MRMMLKIKLIFIDFRATRESLSTAPHIYIKVSSKLLHIKKNRNFETN